MICLGGDRNPDKALQCFDELVALWFQNVMLVLMMWWLAARIDVLFWTL